jgi:RimJ/RimL family protein N-acetyltransferase
VPELTFDGGVLRRLSSADAPAYHDAVQRNRDHLTAIGDYLDEVELSIDDFRQRFGDVSDQSLLMGIWRDDVLVGHVALLHREPPRWGLGYWRAREATGLGIATAAVGAVLEFGRHELGVEEVLAGVTHGNAKSVAVLERLGFEVVADFATYTRFGKTFSRHESTGG